jgi:hypothetical protein
VKERDASEPRRDVLERNLALLLRRSYSPALPRAPFVARLEQRLAPWIGPPLAEGPRPGRLSPWVLGAAIGVAAAVVLLVLGPRLGLSRAPSFPLTEPVVERAPLPRPLEPAPSDQGAQPLARQGDGGPPLARPGGVSGRSAVPVPGPLGTPSGAGASPAGRPASGEAVLGGRVAVLDAPLPAELEVVLLRAVPLPAVAWPESRRVPFAPAAGEPGQGSFRWDGLEAGTYLVQVNADGLAPASAQGVVLAAGSQLELDFTLAPGAVLSGHVVDALTGAPLVGALVVSESDAPVQILGTRLDEIPSEVRARALTGPGGRFVLTDLVPGTQRLRASHPERAPSWLEVHGLAAGEERAGALLELTHGGSVAGRVEGPDGRPSPGTEVIASRMSGADGRGMMTYGSATTDDGGRYSIERLAPGTYAVLDVGARGALAPEELRPRFTFSTVQEGRAAAVDFLAPAGRPSLVGRVLGADGQALRRGVVQLVPRRDDGRWMGEEGMLSTSIGADGSFTFTGLAPGPHALYTGRGDDTVLREVLDVPASGRIEREYVLAGATLAGTVTDARDGAPVVRAALMLRARGSLEERPELAAGELVAAKAWTAADGTYRVEHLPAGRYAVLALDEASGRAMAVVDEVLVPTTLPLDLRLVSGGVLELSVRDSSGAPVGGARLELIDPAGVALGELLDVRTDPEGRARLTRLAPGRWTVAAQRAGRRSAPVSLDVLPDSTRAGQLVLPLER